MNIFIGWSKEKSRRLAEELRNWLPLMNEYFEPFISSQDIEAGEYWREKLEFQLKMTDYGILCLTEENLHSEWLAYEAGELSLATGDNHPNRTAHVVPLLFGVEHKSRINHSIRRFQSIDFNRRGMWQLVSSMNDVCRTLLAHKTDAADILSPAALEKSFNDWYPLLEETENEILRSFSASEQNTYQETLPQGISAVQTPSFHQTLELLYEGYGFYPEIGRIYFEGRQLDNMIADAHSSLAEKVRVFGRFDTILQSTIEKLQSNTNDPNPGRKDRIAALQQLQSTLRTL